MVSQHGRASWIASTTVRCDMFPSYFSWECCTATWAEAVTVPRHSSEENVEPDGWMEKAARGGVVDNNGSDERSSEKGL